MILNISAFSQPSIAWQRCYGSSGDDYFSDAIICSDGGYAATMYYSETDGDASGLFTKSFPAILTKFNPDFSIQWQSFFGGTTLSNGFLKLFEIPDKSFTCFGLTNATDGDFEDNHGSIDLMLVNTDSIGNKLWSNCYGSPGTEDCTSFIPTQDQGYLITGRSYSSGGDIPFHYGTSMTSDAIIIKLDKFGNIEWVKNLGGSDTDSPLGDPVEFANGVYQVHIYSSSFDHDLSGSGITDIKKRWIINLDSLGNIIKESFFSAEDDFLDGDGSTLFSNNKIIIAGLGNADSPLFPSPTGHEGFEGALATFDTSQNLIDMKQWGGSLTDIFYRSCKDSIGNFYFLGASKSFDYDLPANYNTGNAFDYWLVKTDADFNLIWSQNFGGSDECGDLGCSSFLGNILINNNILYAFIKNVVPNSLPDYDMDCGTLGVGNTDAWIVAFDLSTVISNLDYSSFSVYPNPCNDFLHINSDQTRSNCVTINLYSIAGNKVYEKKLEINETVINVSQIAPALYILEIKQENKPGEYFKIIIN